MDGNVRAVPSLIAMLMILVAVAVAVADDTAATDNSPASGRPADEALESGPRVDRQRNTPSEGEPTSRRPQDSIALVRSVESDVTVTAWIDGEDSRHAGFPVEVFEVTVPEWGGLVAEARSPDFTPYLIVEEPDGYLVYVEASSDGACRYNLPEAAPGVYWFFAGPANASDRGQVSFFARRYSRGPAAPDATATELGFGRNQGQIEIGAPEHDGKLVAVYARRTGENDRLRFALESDDFDAYLYVVTPDGDVLADDDGLGELNSAITIENTSEGTYRVYASSYSGSATGAFTLTMSRY